MHTLKALVMLLASSSAVANARATPVALTESGQNDDKTTNANSNSLEARVNPCPFADGKILLYNTEDYYLCGGIAVAAGVFTVIGGVISTYVISALKGNTQVTLTGSVGVPTSGEDGGGSSKQSMKGRLAIRQNTSATSQNATVYPIVETNSSSTQETTKDQDDITGYTCAPAYPACNSTTTDTNTSIVSSNSSSTNATNVLVAGQPTFQIKKEVAMHYKYTKYWDQNDKTQITLSDASLQDAILKAFDWMVDNQKRCVRFVITDRSNSANVLFQAGIEVTGGQVYNKCWKKV